MNSILRGEIYYATLDGMGSEQSGQRPVLVLQSDYLNLNSPTTIIAPITSVIKHSKLKSHCTLPAGRPLREKSMVLTEQVRVIDRSRLDVFVGQLASRDMRNVERALCYSLGAFY
jgi:mRNA interferase MazF